MAADLIRAALLYRSGQERDFPIPGGAEVRLGFGRPNEIPIPFEGVSRHHAKISFDGKSYWIEDAGSANGTFLNGRRVNKRERLEHLDVLTFGRKTELIFVRRMMEVSRAIRRGIRAARLEILDGVDAGTHREIPRGSITIGRSRSNNVVADSDLVSKIHARLERTGLQLLLTDLHSSNGTFADGQRIDSKLLKDGDEFSLGGTRTYRVYIEEGDVETNEVALPSSAYARDSQPLPDDWKTRIEWSPEEKAAMDEAFGEARPAGRTLKPAAASPPKTVPTPRVPPPGAPPQAPQRGLSSAQSRADNAAAAPAMPLTPKEAAPPPAEKHAPSAPPAPRAAPPLPAQGSPLSERPQVAPPRAPVVPSLPPLARPAELAPGPRLFLEGQTQTFALAVGTHEVGRIPATVIRLDGPQISRRHAVIRVTETEAILEDLGSSNGTFVNNRRITTPRTLVAGDLVAFGDVRFRVRFAAGPGARRKENGEKKG